MTQATEEKLNNEIKNLKKEVEFIRSAFISAIGRDKEGVYNPKFVKEVFSAIKEKPKHIFTDAKSFLKKLDKQ